MKKCLLSLWTEKQNSQRKEYSAIRFSFSSHVLLPTPCRPHNAYMVNVTNTIDRQAYKPTAKSRLRTVWVETGLSEAEWSYCWGRVALIFRCLRVVFFKYRFSLGVLACLRPGPIFRPAFIVSKKRFQILEVTLYATPMASAASNCIWNPSNQPTTLQVSDSVKCFRWDIALIETTHLRNGDHSFPLCLLLVWKPNFIRCH